MAKGEESRTDTVTVHINIQAWASEVYWYIDSGSSYWYSYNGDYYEYLTLSDGWHSIYSGDTYGDGWHGGYWEITDSSGVLIGGGSSAGQVSGYGGSTSFYVEAPTPATPASSGTEEVTVH